MVMGADGSKPKREHKKLRHWGKKNKKLQDKDPYGEDNGVVSYHAFTTNRDRGGVAPVQGKGRTSAMRSTRAVFKTAAATDGAAGATTTGGGTSFTRQTLPHHPTAGTR